MCVNSVVKHLSIGLTASLIVGCGEGATATRSEPAVTQATEPLPMARSAPAAGGVERVTIKATATGPTVQVAIDRAIRLAFEQVNGKSFDAATIGIDAAIKGQIGDESIEASSSAFADVVVTQTRGAVSGFRLVSKRDVGGGVEVEIEASVERFVQPESAGQLRVAISPLRLDRSSFTVGNTSIAAARVAQQITDDISDTLLRSQRVTVIDREFDAEIQKELGRIDAGNWKNNDRLRLGQHLAADYLVVGRLDRFEYAKQVRKLRRSDTELVSYSGGASLLVRVINIATGQVEVAETFSIELPATKPTSMGRSIDTSEIVAKMVSGLAKPASQQITQQLFPITVVDVDGEELVLSQGGDLVEEGQVYQVVLRGKEIKDSQTGQVIGRIEKLCCTVLVTTVTPEMSYGVIRDKEIADVASVFGPGTLELRGVVEGSARREAMALPTVSNVATSAQKISSKRTEAKPSTIPEPEEDPDW